LLACACPALPVWPAASESIVFGCMAEIELHPKIGRHGRGTKDGRQNSGVGVRAG
jgi:hypothetical protein